MGMSIMLRNMTADLHRGGSGWSVYMGEDAQNRPAAPKLALFERGMDLCLVLLMCVCFVLA